MYFKDKTIWITGASSGIGKAMAIALSKRGAKLIISSRNHGQLCIVRDECLKYNSTTFIQTLDLEEYHTLAGIAEKVLKKFPKIDILINNGGISQRSLSYETSLAVDKRLMDVNYFGTIALTKAVLPSMMKHHLGQIVTISSLVGKFGTPMRSSYSASKHALHGFFDSLRAELAQKEADIDINIICPGYILTQISNNALIGDGSPQNKLDDAQANGMAAEAFAKKALKAIEKKKNETYIGKKEVLGVYLKRFFPRLFSQIVSKVKVT